MRSRSPISCSLFETHVIYKSGCSGASFSHRHGIRRGSTGSGLSDPTQLVCSTLGKMLLCLVGVGRVKPSVSITAWADTTHWPTLPSPILDFQWESVKHQPWRATCKVRGQEPLSPWLNEWQSSIVLKQLQQLQKKKPFMLLLEESRLSHDEMFSTASCSVFLLVTWLLCRMYGQLCVLTTTRGRPGEGSSFFSSLH